jgi:hypothetical protein
MKEIPSTRRPRRPRWGPRLRRVGLVAAALGGLAVGAAACGGSPPGGSVAGSGGATTTVGPSASGGSDPQSQQAALVKYASCMRSHGVTNFPDPSGSGFLNLPSGVDPNSPQFQSANQACQNLLPKGGGSQVTSPQNLSGIAKYASCMQQHGIQISAGANGQLSFGSSVDPNSPQFQAAQQACQKLVPAGLP